MYRRPGAALPLPTAAARTLILHDAATLTMAEQTQLLDWLNAASPRPQVVSTSAQPLFAQVERGLFAEPLYYRLNVILIGVDR